MGWAMNPVSVLKIRTVDPSSSDRESHNQDNPGCRPISLLSFLEAENVRLHQAVAELSLDARALRESLKRMEAPTTSLGHAYFGLPASVRGRRNCDGLTTTFPFHVTNDSDDSNTSIATCGAGRGGNHRTPVQHCPLHSSCYCRHLAYVDTRPAAYRAGAGTGAVRNLTAADLLGGRGHELA